MHQSGRAGDEAKKRKSPAKSGRVGITAYQNEQNSVKDTGERSKKPCDIDLKISMKILFHCSPTFPFT